MSALIWSGAPEFVPNCSRIRAGLHHHRGAEGDQLALAHALEQDGGADLLAHCGRVEDSVADVFAAAVVLARGPEVGGLDADFCGCSLMPWSDGGITEPPSPKLRAVLPPRRNLSPSSVLTRWGDALPPLPYSSSNALAASSMRFLLGSCPA